MDLVSVIIPVYNVRDYLERCLKSVLSQTYENLEVIVVDNGSTDGSGEICDSFASEDSRVKVIHLENPDVSWARNAGLDSASGDWIMFVDSDDFIHRQAVELLLSAVGGENEAENLLLHGLREISLLGVVSEKMQQHAVGGDEDDGHQDAER